MRSINKSLLRLAVAIHSQLAAPHLTKPLIELPVGSWDRCSQLGRQIRRAQLRGWHLAASELLKDFGYKILSFEDELAVVRERLPRPTGTPSIATIRDIYQDLLALSQEFEELNFDCRAHRLAVVTEPIVLEGVYLGPFEVQLRWARHSSRNGSAYRVIAKDPHPAESRENVTHPHVMDEVLCEGDGRHAVQQALAQGRLLDFFTLIAGILRTYNSESPFVELALWRGCSCSDCGTLVDEDYSYSCHKCGSTICGECEVACCGCDESCCSDCIGSCAACEDNYCRRCLKPCDGCHRIVCSGCLDEHERCTNCHEEESSEDERTGDGFAAPADVAVQPDGLGQALVPA